MTKKKKTDPEPEPEPENTDLHDLRMTVRFFYDLQKLRQQAGIRATDGAKTAELDEADKTFLDRASSGLNDIEKQTLKEIAQLLKRFPIYDHWLKEQRGIGPTMAGVIVSHIDIERAETVSKIWRFCGLAVDARDGKAERRRKGEKTKYDPWLKSKLLFVMGGCILKANPSGNDNPWRDFYDNYKHRKVSTILPQCMACEGKGKLTFTPDKREKDKTKTVKCGNCSGTGGPAPWGKSDAHRHIAAMRYMVKMFLKELYVQWRTLEELPVRAPYAEEYLGKKHHHASAGLESRP